MDYCFGKQRPFIVLGQEESQVPVFSDLLNILNEEPKMWWKNVMKRMIARSTMNSALIELHNEQPFIDTLITLKTHPEYSYSLFEEGLVELADFKQQILELNHQKVEVYIAFREDSDRSSIIIGAGTNCFLEFKRRMKATDKIISADETIDIILTEFFPV